MQAREFYNRRIKELAAIAGKQSQSIQRKSFFRFVLFVCMSLSVYLLFSHFSIILALSAVFVLLLFVVAVVSQNISKQKLKKTEMLIVMSEKEIAALDGDCSAFDNGAEFVDPEHAYSYDLDLFGAKSLFQMINRCFSVSGKRWLAQQLCAGITAPDEIIERQHAIKELASDQASCHDFRYLMMNSNEDKFNAFAYWMKFDDKISSGSLFLFLLKALPVVASVLFVGSFFFPLWNCFYVSLLLNISILYRHKKLIFKYTKFTSDAEKFLQEYHKAFHFLEYSHFESEKLAELQAQLKHAGKPISKITAELAKTISLFEQRNNAAVYYPVNVLLLADLHLIRTFEKWKDEYGASIFEWIGILAEFEGLHSLGTLCFNHDKWAFPSVNPEGRIEIINSGHPLIPEKERVCNNYVLANDPYFMLVTGSNMAGKSSYLRTVGVSLVLAMCGSPVCADQMVFRPVKLFSSMRIVDSLTDSISSFYAELRRMKRITELAGESDSCFFLLDEILRGTNSHDRHIGAKSLIVQLIGDNASGLIASHDIELGKLEQMLSPSLENFSFDVQIKNKELFFDYKIKRGICTSLNASLLMEEAGIKLQGA